MINIKKLHIFALKMLNNDHVELSKELVKNLNSIK